MQLFRVACLLLFAVNCGAEFVPHGLTEADPDGSARYCLSCHDGSRAIKVFDCQALAMCHIYDRHMVDVTYPPAGGGDAYATLEAVKAKGLRFANDKITCYTCHDLRNPEGVHLVSPYLELCKLCHHRH
ncbi:MAG: hypothetical protein HY900_04215 [Deltaproteobacteria bacterium]|nr:hypothetical protein [Deltaproteobacteria bacterium]